MNHVERIAEPEVLATNKTEWTRAFLEKKAKDPAARPSSKQYAHPNIVERLESMSHHKCFYCECSTKETKQEVDHHIECAERPELAFDWANLYLACWDCNHKRDSHRCTPVDACVDPCKEDENPADHLEFEDQFIRGRDTKGLMTIRKYKLDRRDLDYRRALRLRTFDRELIRIQREMIAEGRPMRDDEREHLLRFAKPDAPFSLMFRCYLPKEGI